MSYTRIHEETRKAAKPHRCIWCGENIAISESYTYVRCVFEGDPQSQHWHPECLEDCEEAARQEGGVIEFTPWSAERPVKHPTVSAPHE